MLLVLYPSKQAQFLESFQPKFPDTVEWTEVVQRTMMQWIFRQPHHIECDTSLVVYWWKKPIHVWWSIVFLPLITVVSLNVDETIASNCEVTLIIQMREQWKCRRNSNVMDFLFMMIFSSAFCYCTAELLSWRRRLSSVRPSACKPRYSRKLPNESMPTFAERYLSTISPDHFFCFSIFVYFAILLFFVWFL